MRSSPRPTTAGRPVTLDTAPFRHLQAAMRRARRARILEVDATLVPVRGAEGAVRPAPRRHIHERKTP